MTDAVFPIPQFVRCVAQTLRQPVFLAAMSTARGDGKKATDSVAQDADDIAEARQGDPDAYRRLVERHQAHVGRILWRFSRDRRIHEELVQDVFVEAYLSLGTYHAKGPFEHWLARIATRVGYRYWKEKARRKEFEPFSVEEWDQVVDDEQDVLAMLEPERAAALLHSLLEQLPPRDRLVLTLRYLEECDVAETAQRTGWSKAMVKVQTLRARNKMRKLIEQSGTELLS